METIQEITNFAIAITRIGVTARILFCFIKIITNEDEVVMYKKRIGYILAFYILAESVYQLKDLVAGYFNYTG